MAVVSVKTLHDGWNGTFTSSEMPTFAVVYLVEVDDPQDGNILVKQASGIPRLGSFYRVGRDLHALATCKSISTSPVAGTRNLWQVTASFGTEKGEKEDNPVVGVDEEGQPTDDPLEFAVSMSFSSTRVTRDAIMGTYLGQIVERGGLAGKLEPKGFHDGNAPPEVQPKVIHNRWSKRITNSRPITNSVFRPFDPPVQVEYNRTNIRIQWNTLNSPKGILKYINSVNQRGIVINVFYHWDDRFGEDRASSGQFSIPAFAGRIMGITTSPAMYNGIGYHDNQLEIEVDKLYTWRLDILDRGYATLNNEKTFRSEVKGKGYVVTNGSVSDDGFANREPELLDGSGQAIDIDKMDGVYLRYGVYPEMDWQAAGLDQPRRLKGMK